MLYCFKEKRYNFTLILYSSTNNSTWRQKWRTCTLYILPLEQWRTCTSTCFPDRAILVPATVIIFKKDKSKGIVNEKCITILNAQSWQMMCDLANNNNRLISRGHTKWGWSHFLHRYSLKGIEFLISKYAYFFVIRMICSKRLCGKCYLTTWHFFSIYAILFNSITIYVFIV